MAVTWFYTRGLNRNINFRERAGNIWCRLNNPNLDRRRLNNRPLRHVAEDISHRTFIKVTW